MASVSLALRDLYTDMCDRDGGNSVFSAGVSTLLNHHWTRLGAEAERMLHDRNGIGLPESMHELVADLYKIVKFGYAVAFGRAGTSETCLEKSDAADGAEELKLAVGSPG